MRCRMSLVSFTACALVVLAILSVQASAQTLTTLASFDGTNGALPFGSLTLSADGSTVYGMTMWGGANFNGNYGSGDGTIFSMPVGGGTPTLLATFNGTNGANPYGNLTLSGSTLFGMTNQGGAYSDASGSGYGTLFSISTSGGTLTTMLSFNGTNGGYSRGDLTLSADGSTLYGMSFGGGDHGYGSVFSLPTPEPSTATLLGIGSAALLACGWWRRWRR